MTAVGAPHPQCLGRRAARSPSTRRQHLPSASWCRALRAAAGPAATVILLGIHHAGARRDTRPRPGPAWLTFLAVSRSWPEPSGEPGRWSAANCGCAAQCRPMRRAFAVYFASTVGAGYQVGMWLPYFMRIGRPFVIITRTAPMLAEIERSVPSTASTVPLIYRPTPAQPGGGHRRLADHRVLRQQRRPQHPLHRAARADPRLAQPRRLGEAGLLQPGARDLRPDLRRRPGRHRPLRPARRAHPRGEVPHRRPATGRADHAAPGPRSQRSPNRRCCTRPPGRGRSPTAGSTRCPWASGSSSRPSSAGRG